MKIVISESQYKRLIETEEEQKILKILSMEIFNNDWFLLQKFLEKKGNPPYSIGGDLDLSDLPIKSLGNLKSVGRNLYLQETPIESLGNLTSVGGSLYLSITPIKSLGNLTSVGRDLALQNTSISEKYSREEIRQMVNVDGEIYL